MFITKKYISRRTVLRGAGANIALPLLDAMIPAHTALARTAAAYRPRMAFIYFPHGAVMDKWTPAATGSDFELPQILKPLAPFQKQLTVVSGLENKAAIAAPVHAITPGTWLSCVAPRISHDPYGGVTIDQIAAQNFGQDTSLPSLEIATEERGGEGSCDRNYGCSHGKTISFRTPSTPLPMEHNPRKLFQRLFGQGDTPQERVRLSRESVSILDMVRRDTLEMEKDLGPRDRALLHDYLDNVREIERRVDGVAKRDMTHLEVPGAPAGIPTNFNDHIVLMFDLLALAFQADLTRVATYMMASEVSNQPYNFIGIADAFHPLSHHQNNPPKMERLARVQTYHTEVFAKFLKKLQDTPDGENNMLESSVILYGSNMSNSNQHDHFPLPTAILGRGAGRIRGNQHLKYADRTPLANLHLTLLERAGVELERFGDSSDRFAEI